MNNKTIRNLLFAAGMVFTIACTVCCSNSAIEPSLFNEDGHAVYMDSSPSFAIKKPGDVQFFVEVSGSMNGFFRANKATEFKQDVYEIMSHYLKTSDSVNIMQDQHGNFSSFSMEDFRVQMNTGKFCSSPNSTNMKGMLSTVMNNVKKKGDVAVLISDMKFDPVGGKAPDVQVAQYSTDISKLIKDFGGAVSLVCATSNYLDAKGNEKVSKSPYYFLIVGNGPQVASVRNMISQKLSNSGHFVDNIETGFDYGRASFSFGIPTYCNRIDEEPSFNQYEEEDDIDTCTIKLKVELQNYRWLLSDERTFQKAFNAKCLHGSEVRVASTSISNEKDTPVATVVLKLSYMPDRAEVIEWNIELPDQDHSKMDIFWQDAEDPNDPSKSFSLDGFCKGMFNDGNGNKPIKPNYILITK